MTHSIDVPATVVYHTKTLASVFHPDGLDHPNARLTVARLQLRGFKVISRTVHHDPETATSATSDPTVAP